MDLLWDYLQASDIVVDNIVSKAESIDKDIFMIDGINYKKAFANYIWELIYFGNLQKKNNKQKLKEN